MEMDEWHLTSQIKKGKQNRTKNSSGKEAKLFKKPKPLKKMVALGSSWSGDALQNKIQLLYNSAVSVLWHHC